jgi:hypothetical protein
MLLDLADFGLKASSILGCSSKAAGYGEMLLRFIFTLIYLGDKIIGLRKSESSSDLHKYAVKYMKSRSHDRDGVVDHKRRLNYVVILQDFLLRLDWHELHYNEINQ